MLNVGQSSPDWTTRTFTEEAARGSGKRLHARTGAASSSPRTSSTYMEAGQKQRTRSHGLRPRTGAGGHSSKTTAGSVGAAWTNGEDVAAAVGTDDACDRPCERLHTEAGTDDRMVVPAIVRMALPSNLEGELRVPALS